MSRGGGHAGERQADGWSFAGGPTPRPPPKAGDPLDFGKINKHTSVVVDPSSVWADKEDTTKRDSTPTRVNSSPKMYMMYGRDVKPMPETGSKLSQPSSRRTSVGFASDGITEPQRKKSQLFSRLKSVEEENKAKGSSTDHSEDEADDDPPPAMPEAEARRKIAGDTMEFFLVRDIDESEVYFTRIPPEHHH
jgi:translation initiation factor 4G